ncbi:MAG: amidohydrolase [Chloroflexi bacterium]|nr:amidohydrolase [Chloroflexota bacterium]
MDGRDPERMIEIFRARRILTLSDNLSGTTIAAPDALAVVGERVAGAGAVEALTARFPGAVVTDLGDRVIVPGFNDAHIHPSIVAEDLLNLDVSAGVVRSLADLTRRVLEESTRTAPGTWIRASRYDDAKMAEGRLLTRWDLDEVAPDHPVLVVQVAGHWGVVNSKALELGSLTDTSEAPPGGEYGRDASGRLNGVLYERALFEFAYPAVAAGPTVVPAATLEERLGGLQRAFEMFHAAGLTSLGDALVGPRDLALYQEAERRGLLSARVSMLISYEYFDALERLGLRSGFGSDRLRISGVKAFVDGAIGGRTCLLEQPFEGTDYLGMQTTSTAELAEIVRRVHRADSRLGVHANGDRAIALLLDQLEAAEAEYPRPDAHHRIEHCSVITEDILRRMQCLGTIAVPFGSYVHYHGGKLLEWYGAERAERMIAHRSFLDAGVAVAGSSDYPCGPFEPLLAMQSCATRRGSDGAAIGLSQRISPLEALRLYTTAGAYASGEQAVKGKLAPGYLADFVVLGDDPTTVDPERLSAIPVQATYVGGRRVWSAEASA